MTNREFLTNIANGTLTNAEMEHAVAALAKIDAANEARKNKPSKKAVENAPILESIVAVLGTEPKITADIAAEVGITPQKASALCRQLVAAGKAVQSDVKVPKKGALKAYAIVEADAVGETDAE